MKLLLALLICTLSCWGQVERIHGISEAGITPKSALSEPSDQVFPHIAMGGGWETVIVIVNMSAVPIDFVQHFHSDNGSPLLVTFKDYPNSNVTTDTGAVGHLPPGQSFNFALFSTTADVRTGWASLEYNPSLGRLGAYAIFRLLVPGRAVYESLVPLSAYDDSKFFLPFDNIQGFVTAMSLVNTSAVSTNHVTVTARDLQGVFIDQVTLTLGPNAHIAFALTQHLPTLGNRLGTLYVTSDTNRLAAMGIRFNGAAFSSIPIMNWIGMFQ